MKLVIFSKKFQELPLPEFGDLVADMGFEGVDLTVRPTGYITPEEVVEKLPEAVDILKARGLEVPMITTAITSAEEPYAEETFKTASECGVKYIKLGYWKYKGFGHLRSQIDEIRRALKDIQALSKKYNVTAGMHTHSGMNMSAEPAILWEILKDFNPDLVGAYIDPGHMAVEGGLGGWLMGMDILAEKIRMVAVKDYGWFKKDGKWIARTVPLGEGLVPWRKVFEILKRIEFKGPVSLHSEYKGMSLEEIIEQTRKDIKYVREILKSI